MTYDNAEEVRVLAERHGFKTKPVAMKNTHHAEMNELLIGRDLGWVENGGVFREEPPAYRTGSPKAQHGKGKRKGLIVQFHPAYAYEDLIQGIRPQSGGSGGLTYPLVSGRFLDFCKKAESCHDTCVLIIDEINRANLARVFGELMYLLEYRKQKIALAGGTTFQIPENVRLIGTMNTADRSIALVDHALRRRFAFLPLSPQYGVIEKFHEKTGFASAGLIQVLKSLNSIINDKHYHVGISFFLCPDLKNELGDIWELEIEPYLEEFFFDQPDKLEPFRWEKIKPKVLA